MGNVGDAKQLRRKAIIVVTALIEIRPRGDCNVDSAESEKLGLKSFLKDKLIDLGVVAIGLLTILGFLGVASLSGVPVTILFTKNSPEEAYILAGFAGCMVTMMLFRRRNVNQQEMLANWLGFVTEKAGLFHDQRLKAWSDEWATQDETRLEVTWRTKALSFIVNSIDKEEPT